MDKEIIKEKIKAKLPFLAERYHVKKMGIFGSVARGDDTKKSDIDILVEFDEEAIGMFDFIRLENFLSDLLGKKVDLVSKGGLKSIIKDRILKETIYV